MKNQGFIKLNRSISDSWLWQDCERFQWWCDLLMMAGYEDYREVLFDGRLVGLHRGQLIASVTFLAKRWGRSLGTVRNFLKMLEKTGMIRRHSVGRATRVVTVVELADKEVVRSVEESATPSVKESATPSPQPAGKSATPSAEAMPPTKEEEKRPEDIFAWFDTSSDAHSDSASPSPSASSTSSETAPQVSADGVVRKLRQKTRWRENVCRSKKLTQHALDARLDDFRQHLLCTETNPHHPEAYFMRWLTTELHYEKQRQNYGNFKNDQLSRRRGTETTSRSAAEYYRPF